jgi:hypothetical protein
MMTPLCAVEHDRSVYVMPRHEVTVRLMIACTGAWQVSFGIHETEEEAAKQYDRALIIEKGRAAKTNFPLAVYDKEVVAFEGFVARR